jgi:tungstate transport system substrate-binding protein
VARLTILHDLAAALNERGIPTASGAGQWQGASNSEDGVAGAHVHFRRCTMARDIGKRLAVGIAHDLAAGHLFGGPGRGEAARGHCGIVVAIGCAGVRGRPGRRACWQGRQAAVGVARRRIVRISMLTRRLLIIAAATACLVAQAVAQDKSIVVASTTSTQDSGLFGYLLPIFTQKTGIVVKVVAQGTGQALDAARRVDADVVFVHAKSAEQEFLSQGFGVKRNPVMYNDFVLIGPQSDPAGIKGKDILAALKTIKDKAAPFVSRGDRSGTHIAELDLWKDAGIDIAKERGAWYRSIGQGMGAALNMASTSNAYVLSDRGAGVQKSR